MKNYSYQLDKDSILNLLIKSIQLSFLNNQDFLKALLEKESVYFKNIVKLLYVLNQFSYNNKLFLEKDFIDFYNSDEINGLLFPYMVNIPADFFFFKECFDKENEVINFELTDLNGFVNFHLNQHSFYVVKEDKNTKIGYQCESEQLNKLLFNGKIIDNEKVDVVLIKNLLGSLFNLSKKLHVEKHLFNHYSYYSIFKSEYQAAFKIKLEDRNKDFIYIFNGKIYEFLNGNDFYYIFKDKIKEKLLKKVNKGKNEFISLKEFQQIVKKVEKEYFGKGIYVISKDRPPVDERLLNGLIKPSLLIDIIKPLKDKAKEKIIEKYGLNQSISFEDPTIAKLFKNVKIEWLELLKVKKPSKFNELLSQEIIQLFLNEDEITTKNHFELKIF